MNILRRLFKPREKAPDVRAELLEAVEDAVGSILLINLKMLGYEPCECSIDGPTSSKKARGYLLGLAEAVIGQYQEVNPTEDEFLVSASSAMMFVHDNKDPKRTWKMVINTIDEYQANDPDVIAGHVMAHDDVEMMYSDQPFKTCLGFYLIVKQD